MTIRASSHIVGASMLSHATNTKIASTAISFYEKLLPKAAAGLFAERIMLDTALPPPFFHRQPVWVPHVALEAKELEAALESGVLSTLVPTRPSIDGVPSGLGKKDLFLNTLNVGDNGPPLPFIVHVVDEGSTSLSKDVAPFEQGPPFPVGSIPWMDLCVAPGSERATAVACRRAFGWHIADPIILPGEQGDYITLLNNTGKSENKHKMCGILPAHIILRAFYDVSPKESTPLMFFACDSDAMLKDAVARMPELGGEVHMPPFNADGKVTICRDPAGAFFALYNRSDSWDGVKSGTKILDNAEELFRKAAEEAAAKKK